MLTPKSGQLALFFDTETTGLPLRHAPASSPNQPKLVQLAYVLGVVGGPGLASCSCVIKPDGWMIPTEASNVHGITNEIAAIRGIPLKVAASHFGHHVAIADILVAHNIGFDVLIMSAAFHQIGWGPSVSRFESMPQFCTQEASAAIVNLPPTERMIAAGRNHPKSPQLGEAYEHFTGEKLEGAHDALVDVRACQIIFDKLLGFPADVVS